MRTAVAVAVAGGAGSHCSHRKPETSRRLGSGFFYCLDAVWKRSAAEII